MQKSQQKIRFLKDVFQKVRMEKKIVLHKNLIEFVYTQIFNFFAMNLYI